jgi:hypothetical protein
MVWKNSSSCPCQGIPCGKNHEADYKNRRILALHIQLQAFPCNTQVVLFFLNKAVHFTIQIVKRNIPKHLTRKRIDRRFPVLEDAFSC